MLGSALVDRARVVEREPLPSKVGGSTQFETVLGEWFRCRLTLPAAQEVADASGARRRPVTVPTLLYGLRDVQGGAVLLSTDLRLEVASPELGTAEWNIVSTPEPLRRRRSLVGYQITLRAVGEPTFAPARETGVHTQRDVRDKGAIVRESISAMRRGG